MTGLTSPPKSRKTAFMGFDSADMQAPPVPRADRDGAAAAVVQDDVFDLATSSFRPTVHPVLAGLKQARRMLAEVQAPVVEILRAELKSLHEVGSLGSSAENAQAVATVNELAKRCGMDLTYKGEPVALVFGDRAHYKAGTFRLVTFGANRRLVYEKTAFPELELIPSDPSRRT